MQGRNDERFSAIELSSEQCAAFRRDGYLVVGRTLTSEGLAVLRSECMDAWDAEKKGFDPDATWLQNSLVVDIHHRSRSARSFYFRGPLVDVATQLVGPNIKGATSQLTFKMRGNTMPFAWHQDNGYGELDPYNAISTLTALDDTDESNGCLWVIPGSHLEGQLDVGREVTVETKDSLEEVAVTVDESRALPVPLSAGESLVLHCLTLHKSEGNRSDRDRRVLFLRYADADAVEVYNDRRPRLGRLLRGTTQFDAVRRFESDLDE